MRYLTLLGFFAALTVARGQSVNLISSVQSIEGTVHEDWQPSGLPPDPGSTYGSSDGPWAVYGESLDPISSNIEDSPYQYASASATLAPLGFKLSGMANANGLSYPPHEELLIEGKIYFEAKASTLFHVDTNKLMLNFTENGTTQWAQDFDGSTTLTDLTTNTVLVSIQDQAQDFYNGPRSYFYTFDVDPSHDFQFAYDVTLTTADSSNSSVVMNSTLTAIPEPSTYAALLAGASLLFAAGRAASRAAARAIARAAK
jgi:hypothetical protein